MNSLQRIFVRTKFQASSKCNQVLEHNMAIFLHATEPLHFRMLTFSTDPLSAACFLRSQRAIDGHLILVSRSIHLYTISRILKSLYHIYRPSPFQSFRFFVAQSAVSIGLFSKIAFCIAHPHLTSCKKLHFSRLSDPDFLAQIFWHERQHPKTPTKSLKLEK